jgi:hypothetical protein
MTPNRVHALALLAALSAGPVSCKAGRSFTALPSDYRDYRATRVGDSLEARLAAAALYLERHPRGAYVADVRAFFQKAEPLFFQENRQTIPGLVAYLDVLPSGPHSELAAERLALLRAARDAPDLLGRSARETEARLADAERSRIEAREAYQTWIGYFLDPRVFVEPLRDVESDLVVAWSLGIPAPTCAPAFDLDSDEPRQLDGVERCSKLVEHEYRIPERADGASTLGARSLLMEVFVTQEGGVFRTAALAGPDLFTRLDETLAKAPRSASSTSQRIAAITTAVDLLTGAFEEAVSTDPACRRPATAPVVLHLACGGLELVARAGEAPGDDDVVEIRPLVSSPVVDPPPAEGDGT